VWVGIDGSSDVCCYSRLLNDKLRSNGWEQQSCVAPASLASLEEEASTKNSFVGKRFRDCACYGGLPGSCHAVQPEDAFALWVVCPCRYLPLEVNSGAGETSRIVLVRMRVEGCILRDRKLGKDEYMADIKDLSTASM
jgi:hypothetical protein